MWAEQGIKTVWTWGIQCQISNSKTKKSICWIFVVARFDFTGRTPLLAEETTIVAVASQGEGRVDGVLMWWDLEMDYTGETILSCAPRWAHPTPHNMQVSSRGYMPCQIV